MPKYYLESITVNYDSNRDGVLDTAYTIIVIPIYFRMVSN